MPLDLVAQKVENPGLIRANPELAQLLGIDPAWLFSDDGIATMAGNLVPEGADPIATVYAGHQFGSWNPHQRPKWSTVCVQKRRVAGWDCLTS